MTCLLLGNLSLPLSLLKYVLHSRTTLALVTTRDVTMGGGGGFGEISSSFLWDQCFSLSKSVWKIFEEVEGF